MYEPCITSRLQIGKYLQYYLVMNITIALTLSKLVFTLDRPQFHPSWFILDRFLDPVLLLYLSGEYYLKILQISNGTQRYISPCEIFFL